MPQHKGSKPRGTKKGGAGKFSWGVAGEVIDITPLKRSDPAYMPEEDDPDYQSSSAPSTAPAPKKSVETSIAERLGISTTSHESELAAEGGSDHPSASTLSGVGAIAAGASSAGAPTGRMSLGEYKKAISPLILEFFSGADLAELYRGLSELDAPLLRWEFIKRAITMSMDRGDRERELVSRAVSELFDVLLTHSHVARAFERLLEQADDLALDVPSAHDILAKFIARAVHDEILPPSFLTDPNVTAIGGAVVPLAVALLSIRQASTRLERIWGVSDANASVSDLKRELSLLVEEFFVGGDIPGTLAGLKALAVPHLMHEAVKRALLLAIDRGQEQREAVVKLFSAAAAEHVFLDEVMQTGFHIVHGRLDDVKLDTPNAAQLFDEITTACIAAKALPEGFKADGEQAVSATAAAAAAK